MNIFELKQNADRVAGRLVLAFGVASAQTVSVLTHAPNASAQDYPSKPIRLIAPFAAGTVLESNAKRSDEYLVLEDLRRATKVVARSLSELLQ
jgi:tripartite-type tricarboxylate transporter receptor subunit TctC